MTTQHSSRTTESDIDRRFRLACDKIAGLCCSKAITTSDGLERLQFELEQIPLTSDEFQLAINRLNNARTYVERAEPFAARYEAKLLLGLVRRCQAAFESRTLPRMATRRP